MAQKKILKYFDSHEEADNADFEYYLNLTPDERIQIGLELCRPYYDAYPRFERIFRAVDLGECPVSSDWRLGL